MSAERRTHADALGHLAVQAEDEAVARVQARGVVGDLHGAGVQVGGAPHVVQTDTVVVVRVLLRAVLERPRFAPRAIGSLKKKTKKSGSKTLFTHYLLTNTYSL